MVCKVLIRAQALLIEYACVRANSPFELNSTNILRTRFHSWFKVSWLISGAVEHCWELLDSNFRVGLTESMPKRMKLVIGTYQLYTRYCPLEILLFFITISVVWSWKLGITCSVLSWGTYFARLATMLTVAWWWPCRCSMILKKNLNHGLPPSSPLNTYANTPTTPPSHTYWDPRSFLVLARITVPPCRAISYSTLDNLTVGTLSGSGWHPMTSSSLCACW